MDRLHLVAALLLVAAAGCDDDSKSTKTSPTPSRVNAVAATQKQAEAPADFCDVYNEDSGAGADFGYPELAGDAPNESTGWRWINVWATWCKPCIEEMPRLAKWETELKPKLADIAFVSADDTAEIVSEFRATHENVPKSARLASPDLLQPWLNELGLAGSPSLPVHIFVDGSDKVRCIRMAGVNDSDRTAVERLLQ